MATIDGAPAEGGVLAGASEWRWNKTDVEGRRRERTPARSDLRSPTSDLCPFDIVKRVVTVKQVRPSPILLGGVRSGLGMGMRKADARASAGRCPRSGGQRSDVGGQKSIAFGHVPALGWSDL
jgi:hypothetical protein